MCVFRSKNADVNLAAQTRDSCPAQKSVIGRELRVYWHFTAVTDLRPFNKGWQRSAAPVPPRVGKEPSQPAAGQRQEPRRLGGDSRAGSVADWRRASLKPVQGEPALSTSCQKSVKGCDKREATQLLLRGCFRRSLLRSLNWSLLVALSRSSFL